MKNSKESHNRQGRSQNRVEKKGQNKSLVNALNTNNQKENYGDTGLLPLLIDV